MERAFASKIPTWDRKRHAWHLWVNAGLSAMCMCSRRQLSPLLSSWIPLTPSQTPSTLTCQVQELHGGSLSIVEGREVNTALPTAPDRELSAATVTTFLLRVRQASKAFVLCISYPQLGIAECSQGREQQECDSAGHPILGRA